jgi:NADP-dependent 3-hydroxy acid dehydrogenase YdfG
VTGASSGIGLETSKHLVKDGWKVFGIDINYENKVALGELSNNNLFKPLVCDLTSEDEVYKNMNIIQERSSVYRCINCLRRDFKIGRALPNVHKRF